MNYNFLTIIQRFRTISVGGKKCGQNCIFDKSITTAEMFTPPIEKDDEKKKKSKKKSFRSGNTVFLRFSKYLQILI
jgi:hypothetical protein